MAIDVVANTTPVNINNMLRSMRINQTRRCHGRADAEAYVFQVGNQPFVPSGRTDQIIAEHAKCLEYYNGKMATLPCSRKRFAPIYKILKTIAAAGRLWPERLN